VWVDKSLRLIMCACAGLTVNIRSRVFVLLHKMVLCIIDKTM